MSNQPPHKPRTRDPERTRSQLLKTAIRLFSARGYHGVSVDEIVTAAKVNKRMVYHYFGSKEELYLEALSEVFSRLSEPESGAVTTTATPDEKLRRLLAAYFEFLDENPEFVRMLLWENLDGGRHLAAKPGRLNKNPFVERFRAIIEEGVTARIFRAPRDTRHLLVNIIGICFIYHSNRHSLAVSMGIGDDEAERKIRREQACDLVLHGLGVRA
jgi:Transcriptional regulator